MGKHLVESFHCHKKFILSSNFDKNTVFWNGVERVKGYGDKYAGERNRDKRFSITIFINRIKLISRDKDD